MITLKKAYNHYSQQDVPENIFNILFNYTPPIRQNTPRDIDYAKQAKDEIYQHLWEIIEAKCGNKGSEKRWIPGSVHFPALVVQLLRVRFPSSEPYVFLPDCIMYDMKDFIEYTSA